MPVLSLSKVIEEFENHSWYITRNKNSPTYIATRSGNYDICFFENSVEEMVFVVEGWCLSSLENAVKKSRKVR